MLQYINHNRRGQTTLEYAFLITVVLAAFLSIQIYFKRGIQGRWKSSVDSFGELYAPVGQDTNITHSMNSTTTTIIDANVGSSGIRTSRSDVTTSTDTVTGTSSSPLD